MCDRCETEGRAQKVEAIEQAKKILETLSPETEVFLFMAKVDQASPDQTGLAVCSSAGALSTVGMAALLSEIHGQVQGDPMVMDLAAKFMAMRKEQIEAKAAAAEKNPLDLSSLLQASDLVQ